ncbi:PD-(D/E)XK nuclease family protein [Mycobacterium pyrenivorans]|nr:PD-(D/E)XK nuclease family protein [Mycolicibacterium pyrenivorans]
MTDPVDREWLSPTRAWRLTECAASVSPVVNTAIALTSDAPNAGTVAHRAVQLWIKSDGYRDGDVRGRLSDAINTVLAETGGRPVVGEWTSTRARLLARASQLAERLHQGSRVISEEELRDPRRALLGTPDIVVIGQDGAIVIDLKTPTARDASIPPWIDFQLTIYAHLVQHEYGVLPRRAEVFRLNKGLMPIGVSQSSVAAALDLVEYARQADRSVATPSLETCRYCRRRIDCESHWDAAPAWTSSDCAEGAIERIERAANGVTAILLRSEVGTHWVSGVPTELVTASIGDHLRLVRLQRSKSTVDLVGFKWSRVSALSVLRDA